MQLITSYFFINIPLKLTRLVKQYQFVNEKLMSKMRKYNGEYISKSKLWGDMWKRYNVILKGFLNRMTIHLDMISSFVKNYIDGNLNSPSIVNI